MSWKGLRGLPLKLGFPFSEGLPPKRLKIASICPCDGSIYTEDGHFGGFGWFAPTNEKWKIENMMKHDMTGSFEFPEAANAKDATQIELQKILNISAVVNQLC